MAVDSRYKLLSSSTCGETFKLELLPSIWFKSSPPRHPVHPRPLLQYSHNSTTLKGWLDMYRLCLSTEQNGLRRRLRRTVRKRHGQLCGPNLATPTATYGRSLVRGPRCRPRPLPYPLPVLPPAITVDPTANVTRRTSLSRATRLFHRAQPDHCPSYLSTR